MGKGIALQFKGAFPHNYDVYVQACRRHELTPGKLLTVWDSNLLYGKKYIVNFPTKTDWRLPSRYEYVAGGLQALKALIEKEHIRSIALPALGANNGGLDWPKVRQMIVQELGTLPADIQVYAPMA